MLVARLGRKWNIQSRRELDYATHGGFKRPRESISRERNSSLSDKYPKEKLQKIVRGINVARATECHCKLRARSIREEFFKRDVLNTILRI